MTANIVYKGIVASAEDLQRAAEYPQRAESWTGDTVPGQLWEREAERTMVTTSLQNVTDEQADKMHAVLYSAQRRARIFERGPLATSPSSTLDRSGSIKRGVLAYAKLLREVPTVMITRDGFPKL